MLASMAVFFLWMALAPRLGFAPRPPLATQPADGTGTTTAPVGIAGVPTSASGPVVTSTAPAEPHPDAVFASDEQTMSLGSLEPNGLYELEAICTNHGAAIKEVHLAGYWNDVDAKDPYPVLYPVVAPAPAGEPEREYYSWATEKLRIVGTGRDIFLSDVLWQQQAIEDTAEDGTQAVAFTVTVPPKGPPLLKLTKRFTLHPTVPGPKKTDDKRRFDITVGLEVENLSDRQLSVILTQRGPVGILKEDPRSDLRRAVGAVSSTGSPSDYALEEAVDSELGGPEQTTKALGGDDVDRQLAWGAIQNKYFACFARPLRPADSTEPVIAECRARALTANEALDDDFTIELITSQMALAPGAKKSLEFQAYFGPKSQRVFSGEAYTGLGYENLVAYGLGSCTFGWLTKLMMWLLNSFEAMLRNYGLAIIVLVVIVRTVLHPVTKKGQVNMMKMQKSMAALQPKMEELKAKYGNDRQKLNNETMALYREEGVNPAGNMLTCLPMFLQMPIWIALWTSLASTIEMRHAPLLFEGYWIKDLTGPDALIEFSRGFSIPLISWMPYVGEIESFNILPILLGISMYLQQRFMSKLARPATPAGKNPDQMAQQQAQQQKIMGFMTVFFTIMLYNAPSGLNLYIMASNFFGLLEQYRIRKHIQDEDAQGRLAPKKKPKKPGQRSWIEWLQKKAEEAQKPQAQSGGKKPPRRK